MTENINAYCKICGEGYHVCNSCLEQNTFKPWRTIVDTVEHYKIYLAIHHYTITKDKETAKEYLNGCDLSGLSEFLPEIQTVIKEIIEEPKKVKSSSRCTKIISKTVESKNADDINE